MPFHKWQRLAWSDPERSDPASAIRSLWPVCVHGETTTPSGTRHYIAAWLQAATLLENRPPMDGGNDEGGGGGEDEPEEKGAAGPGEARG